MEKYSMVLRRKKGERFINLFLEIENRPKMMKGD